METKWWQSDEDDHRALDIARQIRDRQTDRDTILLDAACLFDDFPSLGFAPAQYSVRRTANRQRLSLNVVRSCCTTVQSEVIQARPRPMFLTTDGDWSVRRKARKLTQFIEGVFAEADFDRLAARAAMDAAVFGTGCVRGFIDHGRLRFERVYPWEVWVDERDSYYDRPRSMYLLRYVDRDVLAELYPNHRALIETTGGDSGGWRWRDTVADQLLVVEAWHLRTGPESGDGKHVIAIEGTTLFREEWPHDWTPLAFLRWRDPLQGFWPQGLAMELDGLQTAINKLLRSIDTGQHYNTYPRIAVERGSRVVKNHLGNEPGIIFDYTGTPPTALTFPAVAPEIYAHLRQLYQWSYEISGVSALTARAEAPPGLQSGVAIKTNSYLQSRRMLDFQRNFERLFLDGARIGVRLMEHAAKDDKAYEVVYQSKHRVERIAWDQAKLDESSYALKVFPVSALPSTPAGRLDAIMEMVNSGFASQLGIQPQEILRLLDFPDLDQVTRAVSASVDLIEDILEQLLDGTDYIRPEEFFDLNLCILLGGRTYQRWRLEKVPSETCDLLLQWIDEARELKDQLAAAAAAKAAPPPPPGPDAAGPLPPPDAAMPPPGLAA